MLLNEARLLFIVESGNVQCYTLLKRNRHFSGLELTLKKSLLGQLVFNKSRTAYIYGLQKEMCMKFILSVTASFLMLIGCGTAAEKIDPVVKAGKVDQSSLNTQNSNGDHDFGGLGRP